MCFTVKCEFTIECFSKYISTKFGRYAEDLMLRDFLHTFSLLHKTNQMCWNAYSHARFGSVLYDSLVSLKEILDFGLFFYYWAESPQEDPVFAYHPNRCQ